MSTLARAAIKKGMPRDDDEKDSHWKFFNMVLRDACLHTAWLNPMAYNLTHLDTSEYLAKHDMPLCPTHWHDPDMMPFLVHNLGSMERVAIVKHGLPAQSISEVASALHMSEDRAVTVLGFPASTIARKKKNDETLTQDQGEKVLEMVRLIGLTQSIISDFGDPELAKDFDAAKWLGEWLERPQPSLGMKKPADFLDTATGIQLVEDLLKRIAVGTFA